MTEKRFTETISTGIITDNKTGIEYNCEMRIDDDFLHLVNTIADEDEQLKFKLDEVRSDEKQLGISFMEFKMKLIEKLQIHYDYATEQRQKNLNDIFVAKAYDIIRHDIKKLAEEMGVDLE